jgi:hypothetical protein
MTLSVHLRNRDFSEFAVPPALQFEVVRFTRHSIGGPRLATITATGDVAAMAQLLLYERCPVDVYDEKGAWTWGGYIAKVAVRNGVVEETRSVDEMANAVRVIYTIPRVGSSGGGGRAETDWATDDESIAEYGRKELTLSFSNLTEAEAEARRDQVLNERKEPVRGVKLPFGVSDKVTAELTCRGLIEALRWRYYADSAGYEAYEGTTSEVPVKIGQAAFTSAGIRFDGSDITLGVERHEVDTEDIIKFGQTAVTASDIGFEDLDEDRIYKITGGLGAFMKGDSVTVSGASEPDNNGVKDVLNVLSDTHLVVVEDLDPEGVGGSITLTPLSFNSGIAQSFTTVGGTLISIQVRMQVCGSAGDGAVINVHADSGGVPGGGSLATLTIPASSLSASMGDVLFSFQGGPSLSSGTYWFIMTRSGANSATSAYALARDAGATYTRGQCLVNTGTWSVPSFGACDLIFEVVTEPASNLQAFVAGDIVTISGSGSNDGTYTLTSAGGYALSVDSDLTIEEAGTSVTITPYGGGFCRQTYQLGDPAGWLAGEVRVRAYKVGSPSDNLVVTVRDNGGTLLATGTLAAANIGTSASWLVWSLDVLVSHVPATTYQIGVARSGSFDSQHGYVVIADESAGYASGVLNVWNGSSYVARSPAADLNFIVVGFRSLLEQVQTIITSAGSLFLAGVDNDATTTLYSNPQRRGDNTALDEMEGLLLDGAGGRILATVGEDRRVRLYNESGAETEIAICADGHLETPLGERIPKHLAPAGVWAELKDIVPSGEATRVFIEGWSYDARGDRLTPTVRGERDPWDIGGIRQG